MAKKCCANCFFFVKVLSGKNGERLMKHLSDDEIKAFRELNLENLDTSVSFKCWKGIWQETGYISEDFTEKNILKNRRKYLFDDECFFLDEENNQLTFRAAEELVQRKKSSLKTGTQLFLTLLIVLTALISLILTFV